MSTHAPHAVGAPAVDATRWRIDPARSRVEFHVKAVWGMATVRGRFSRYHGTLDLSAEPAIELTIEADSLDTANEKRDTHLRSPDFFDAERFPNMTFRSKRVERTSGDSFRVVGDLTIRDITREVELDVELAGRAKDPWGNEKAGFEATTTIKRSDYGLTWNAALETGGVLVGDDVKISIEAELQKQA